MPKVTIATALSMVRIVLIIPLWYCLTGSFEHNRLWAAAVIAVGMATDFLDGLLARRLHQVSELGKAIDPIADKLGVGALAALLVWLGDLPLWFLLVMLTRDALIVAGGLYIRKKKKIIAQSNWPGKIAVTVIAFVLLLATLKIEKLQTALVFGLWLSVVLMGVSLVVYAQRLFIGRVVEKEG